MDDEALPVGEDAGAGVGLELDGDIGAGGEELEAAAGARVLAQDARRQVVPVVEGEHVPGAQPQPGEHTGHEGRGCVGVPPPHPRAADPPPALTRGRPA